MEKTEFQNNNFTPSAFLTSHALTPLTTLNQDLSTLLQSLKEELVAVINQDYEGFIKISTQLTDVDSRVANILDPISDLQEQVDAILQTKLSQQEHIEKLLLRRSQVRLEKDRLEGLLYLSLLITKIEELMVEGDLERIVVEYNQLLYLWEKTGSDSLHWRKDKIEKYIFTALNTQLTQACEEKTELNGILRRFALVDGMKIALDTFVSTIVKPWINVNISPESLSTKGLKGLYSSIVTFLQTDCELIRIKDVEKYDVLGVIVPEIMEKVKTLPIFSAGIPETFHDNYKTTVSFLHEIEEMVSGSEGGLRSMVEFRKKWQLGVYFQIVSTNLTKPLAMGPIDATNPLWIPASQTLIDCLKELWSDKVWLEGLNSKSWKWTCEVINRYSTLLRTRETELISQANLRELFILLKDVQAVEGELDTLYSQISPKFPKGNWREAIKVNYEPNFQELFVDTFVKASMELLSAVRNVPGLYRRTNRVSPVDVSAYVKDVFVSLDRFMEENRDVCTAKQEWLQRIYQLVASGYESTALDLLITVRRTEDSLKKLKKTVKKEGESDEDKIRKQVLLDSLYLVDVIKSRGGNVTLDEIKREATSE
jgi:hypothetical protein